MPVVDILTCSECGKGFSLPMKADRSGPQICDECLKKMGEQLYTEWKTAVFAGTITTEDKIEKLTTVCYQLMLALQTHSHEFTVHK